MSRTAEFLRNNRLAIIIVSVALSAAVILMLISQLSVMRGNILFQRGIRRADVLIREGRGEEAEAVLSQSLLSANSPRDFLMLASRGRQLAENGRGGDLYSRAVAEGFAGFPGNEELRALSVDALIRRGELLAAAEIAEEISSRQLRPIKVEALLLGGRPLESGEFEGLLEGISVPLTPGAMADPFAMFQAGELTGDIRYFVNGAVMLAALGRVDEAYDILFARRGRLTGSADALVLLRLAYDSGAFARADEISPLIPPVLGLQSDTLESLADLYFYSGDPERAYITHQLAVSRDPRGAGMSYYNLLVLEGSLGLRGTANIPALAAEALEYHASDPQIAVRAIIAGDDEASAPLDFAPYISRYPSVFTYELYDLIGSYRSGIPRGNRRTDIVDLSVLLWNRMNDDPEDQSSRDLLLYLLALQDDRAGLDQLLGRYRGSRAAALDLYRGYLAAVYGRRDEARRRFAMAGEGGEEAGWFNLALMDLEERFPARALENLLEAESILITESGNLADQPDNVHYRRLVDIRAYIAFAAVLADEQEIARDRLARINSSGGSHLLIPRVKEMFDDRADN
jgi:hypothetical protein